MRLNKGAHEETFANARRASVAALAAAEGAPLTRIGADLFGPCPCDGASGDKRSRRFHVTPAKNVWHCFGCNEGGGAIELEMKLRGGEPLDAARRLAGALPSDFKAKPRDDFSASSQKAERPRTLSSALRIWRGAASNPVAGTWAQTWLEARGLDVEALAPLIARGLRFHPRATALRFEDEMGSWREIAAPAMVAPIVFKNEAGKLAVRGVHCTYLTDKGRAKARLIAPDGAEIPARKMWGPSMGGAVPFTEWDEAPDDGELLVGEGIETVLSAAQIWQRKGAPCRAAAVLSLNNLQGGYERDQFGCASWPALADAEKPPWTWANAGDVRILVDNDMSPIKYKTRDARRRIIMRELSQVERAELCGSLAKQHWRAAGARNVLAIKPARANSDFNDMVRL